MVFFLVSCAHPSRTRESDLERANALNQQVLKLYQQGHYAKAVPIAEKVLAINEKALGPEHPDVAISLNNLAELYSSLGNYPKAEPLYRRALSIWEKALGPEHPSVATGLNNLAMLYYSLGDYAKAKPLYRKSLMIREKAFGPEHPQVAQSLNNLAGLYNSLGDYAKAEPLYRKALEIHVKALGPEHPSVATSLNNLAMLYYSLGDYAKAEPLYKRALVIVEKALGPEHPQVAQSLNNLANLYNSLGDYAKAEPLYRRALSIWEKALGPEHPSVATSLNNLANLYYSLGDYAKAEPLYKRALVIEEKALGPEHPDVAGSLNNLAMLYSSLGDYAKAEPLYKKALVIVEKALGPEHPNAALSILVLAMLYNSLGDYAKAEPLYRKALEIYVKAFGPEHPQVAISLNNLANLYNSLGDYAKAEPLYRKALEIHVKAFGPEHPSVATGLNNLAGLYKSLGDYAKAESLCKKALSIKEKALGPEHPSVATSLNTLAGLYSSLGNYPKAESLYRKTLEIHVKAFGPEHPSVATSLNNLARVYNRLGNYPKAESLCKKAMAIREKIFDQEHPSVATSLNELALLYAALDDFEKAHDLQKQAQEIDSKLIEQVMGFTSEDQKIKFLTKKKWNLYGFLSLVNQHLAKSPSARIDALAVWLKRKGVILEAQRRFQEALIYSDNPQAMKTFQGLSRVRAQLSKLTFSGPGKDGLNAYIKKIAYLEVQEDRLEARLSQLSQAFALKQKIAKADCEKVAGALPLNTVLIEFARVKIFNFKAKGKEKSWNPAHYLAFVLHAGKGDKVGMIDLGNAYKIDKAIAKFRKEIANINKIKGYKDIKSARKIYKLVFEPLRRELGDVKEIFISPDGNLNLISFEVIQDHNGKYLIEDYTFNYLAAGRDVLRFGQIKDKGQKALLMGDPDFDMGAEEKNSTLRRLALSVGKEEEISRRSLEMKDFIFTRLPGTREEVKTIQAILGEDKAEIYTGKEALEEVLRQWGTPRILHLATHGFFLSDLELGGLMDKTMGRGLTIVPKASRKKVKVKNPLLRSGIALAGANNALKSGDAEKSDGIVTAEKILGLRLRGTDMVVLSACETGLGEVKTGEGVFGLRRAFTQAGSRSLVMSMWSVPDQETKELIVEFYRNIVSGNMNRCQALRQAALNEMKIVKKRYGHTNPYFWGAFVFMGEP